MHKFFSLFTMIVVAAVVSAQSQEVRPCANEDPFLLEQIHHNDPVKIAAIEQADRDLERSTEEYTDQNYGRAAGSTYVIPVVFHVIHENGAENIDEAQIHDAIRILNRDLSKLNPDTSSILSNFASIAANSEIEFRLAQLDPNGNCTRGITRTQSALTNVGDQTMKDLIQWPRNKYLNVWTCAYAIGAAGYSQYPSSVNGSTGAPRDGIVLLHTYVGSIGTGAVSRSRTFTHEVGHWINLRHCWGNSNDAAIASNCNIDDNVADTPLTEGWTSCNINGQTCGSLDNVQNYMEYSGCRIMFTEGQKQRMRAALASSTAQRNQLWTPANLTATGTSGLDVLCAADFTSSNVTVCVGDAVQFTDLSYHGATQWSWTFPGGTANSTIIEDPMVTYTAAGTYDVTLMASNASGSETTVKTAFITVLPNSGLPTPFQDGFESTTSFPNSDWLITNVEQNATFDVSTAASFSGAKSAFINNYTANDGDLDELISTTIDISAAADVAITFQYAFARRTSTNDDRLRIYVSKDCGDTWLLRDQLRGQTDLTTAPDHGTLFIPSGPSEWEFATVNNIPVDYYVSDFRVKFWFESDGGNNLFLDNINITDLSVGLDDLEAGVAGAMLVPNPTAGATELVVRIEKNNEVIVDILDMTGRAVAQVIRKQLAVGTHRILLPTSALPAGVYFIRTSISDQVSVIRLVKN